MSVTLHTNVGDIKIELFCEQTPRTSENFLALCASGYYDNVHFHRNIKGFMIQGGLINSGWRPLSHILTASLPPPSQFFISYKAHAHLNGKYTVFGQVIDGMDVLDRMEKVPVDAQDRPKTDIKINKVTIHANPLAG
ncbi:hypothetical protein GPECTOR_65g166 [Gonium pectorale]|uniref:Peptidyl-prolyl cis-trans isomerase n=1 Tax=Gonium pectorale TaxID=33097 RepID=A0A150G3Z4_GONPE|nr:hypothetical protein GPECTOR_65g166 [Gonium pectorale]|eukprot:KXZ44548.1 hypothetical protein GPECTOR_65g166 [Gonium pectorale]